MSAQVPTYFGETNINKMKEPKSCNIGVSFLPMIYEMNISPKSSTGTGTNQPLKE